MSHPDGSATASLVKMDRRQDDRSQDANTAQ